jgi:hypothetical protein
MAPFCREKSIGSNQKTELKRRAHDLKNQDARQGPTQGFNFLQNSPNWFIWTLNPHLKWA